jgi:hypothetical protein
MINLIKAITRTLKSFNFRSLAKTVLSLAAIVLVVTTTACNGITNAATKPTVNNPTNGKITELYKPIVPQTGGMNNYTDVDPRVDTSKAEGKTDRLIKQAKDLEQKDTNPFKQLQKQFTQKGVNERAEDAVEGVNRSAQETADGVAKGTQKGFGNLKENAKSFKEDVKSAVGDMKQNVREEAENIERSARKNS